MSFRISFRKDQCEFIIAAMNFIIERADAQVLGSGDASFREFSALRTRERALEIRDEIESIIA